MNGDNEDVLERYEELIRLRATKHTLPEVADLLDDLADEVRTLRVEWESMRDQRDVALVEVLQGRCRRGKRGG